MKLFSPQPAIVSAGNPALIAPIALSSEPIDSFSADSNFSPLTRPIFTRPRVFPPKDENEVNDENEADFEEDLQKPNKILPRRLQLIRPKDEDDIQMKDPLKPIRLANEPKFGSVIRPHHQFSDTEPTFDGKN